MENNVVKKFMEGQENTANTLNTLGFKIERVDFSRMQAHIASPMVTRVVTTFPIIELILDMEEADDAQETMLQAVLQSRWTQKLNLKNIYRPIETISPLIEEIHIEAELGTAAIRPIVGNENLRKITLTGGNMNQEDWLYISQRARPLARLELNNTEVTSLQHFREATSRILSLTTRNLICMNGRLDDDGTMNY